jgi:hypothetical protein
MFSTTASLLLTTIIISATVFMLMMPLPATAFFDLPTSSTTLKLVGNQHHSATLFALVLVASIIHLSCLREERTFDDHHTIRLG